MVSPVPAIAVIDEGMWNNTLMIFSSDNGGPVRLAENAANNWPLRGGQFLKGWQWLLLGKKCWHNRG